MYLFARDYLSPAAPASPLRPHAMPDTLLGWVSAPGYASADEYGAGIGLTITPAGFRAVGPAAATSAKPATPIACSGDSYTFGTGVADDRHWCSLLQALVPGLKATNLGGESYSFEQSADRYRRDGTALGSRVHVFALTDGAIERAAIPRAAIPRAAGARAFDDLRFVQEYRRVRGIDREWSDARAADARLPLVEQSLGTIAAADRERGGTLVLAYLPTFRAARRDGAAERRSRLAAFAKARGIPFIDLTPRFHAMRADSLDLSFTASDAGSATAGTGGQLSRLGHAVVAREIAGVVRELAAAPATERLQDSHGPGAIGTRR